MNIFIVPKRTAFWFSSLFVIFQATWGTADIENSPKFDRAFASRYSGPKVGDMAVTNGIGSYWGVPVFDATQGFGYRLPTQGSLGQSPFVFLRWFASVELIQLIYLGFAIFLCSWTIGNYCRDHVKHHYRWAVLLLHATILGPLILFSVVNEWQVSSVGFCSRAILIIFVFHLSKLRTHRESRISESQLSAVVATAFFLIVVGHPGEWSLALPPLILILFKTIQGKIRSKSKSSRDFIRSRYTPQFLIGTGAIFVLLLNVSDLFIELERPVSSRIRSSQTTGITFDQLPSFSFLAEYQRVVELVVALGMSIFGPLVNVFVGSNGRYEFAAFSMLMIVSLDYFVHRSNVPKEFVSTLNSGLTLAALTLGFYLAEVLNFMPELLRSSGAYQHAPQLLIVSVLLWITDGKYFGHMLRPRPYSSFAQKILHKFRKFAVSIAIVGIFAQPISLLKTTSPQGIRNFQKAIKESELSLAENFRNSDPGIRVISNSHSYVVPEFVLAFEGYPTLNNEPKIRNTSTLMLRGVFNQLVVLPDLKTPDQLLIRDFASILPTIGKDKSKFFSENDSKGQTSKLLSSVVSTNSLVTDRSRFHTFAVNESEFVSDQKRCPLFDRPECIHVVSTYISNPRAVPRWKLGNGKVLATYDWAVAHQAWGVLIPMDFDRALRVTDKESKSTIKTHSHFGLLLAQIPKGEKSGTFEVSVDADWKMRLRATAAYYSLFCFGFTLLNLRRMDSSATKEVKRN